MSTQHISVQNDQPITRLIIAFCRAFRLCKHRVSGGQEDVLLRASRMHTAEREKNDQTLPNSSVSLSEEPPSVAVKAIRVNGCVAML